MRLRHPLSARDNGCACRVDAEHPFWTICFMCRDDLRIQVETLVFNLATAARLEHSYWIGYRQCAAEHDEKAGRERMFEWWHPGCGRPAE
jgi:hypothetical protein